MTLVGPVTPNSVPSTPQHPILFLPSPSLSNLRLSASGHLMPARAPQRQPAASHANPRKSAPLSLLSPISGALPASRRNKPGRNHSDAPYVRNTDNPANAEPEGQSDWTGYTCEFLVTHVLRRQHAEIRHQIEDLQQQTEAAVGRDGGAHPELAALRRHLTQMGRELAAQIADEESLFPAILSLELAYVGLDCSSTPPPRVRGNLQDLARHHRLPDRHLDEMRAEALWLAVHADAADPGFSDRLLRLRSDLLLHFQLEDHVLLPRVTQMEAELFGAG